MKFVEICPEDLILLFPITHFKIPRISRALVLGSRKNSLLISVTHCKLGPESFLKFKALRCFELLMRLFAFVSSFIFLDP